MKRITIVDELYIHSKTDSSHTTYSPTDNSVLDGSLVTLPLTYFEGEVPTSVIVAIQVERG